MINININEAIKSFDKIILDLDRPIKIINKNGNNAVLLPEQLYRGLKETIYLQSIPHFVGSIKKAKEEIKQGEFTTYDPNEKW